MNMIVGMVRVALAGKDAFVVLDEALNSLRHSLSLSMQHGIPILINIGMLAPDFKNV